MYIHTRYTNGNGALPIGCGVFTGIVCAFIAIILLSAFCVQYYQNAQEEFHLRQVEPATKHKGNP